MTRPPSLPWSRKRIWDRFFRNNSRTKPIRHRSKVLPALLTMLEDRVVPSITLGDFSAVNQYGSMVYQASGSGLLGGTADVLPLTLDPGQRVTVVVDGDDGLQVRARLLEGTQGNHVLASNTAEEPGGTAVLQSVAVGGNLTTYNPQSQKVRLQVSGVNGNLGEYTVKVYLNATVELEGLGDQSNNDSSEAQSLENSFLQLNRNGNANSNGQQPARAAVVGQTDISSASGIVDEIEINNLDASKLPNPLDFAQDIDPADWVFGKDPVTGVDSSLLSVVGTGDGTFDYYKFTIPTGFAGVSISMSSDFMEVSGGNVSAIAIMFDENGQFVDLTGDPDFFGPIDLSFHDAGVYYIGVGTWYSGVGAGILFGDTPPVGSNYELNFSIIDHPATDEGSGVLFEAEPNDFGDPADYAPPPVDLTQYAQNLDDETWVVNTDPNVPDAATIPHITVNATGDGTFDYYTINIPSGGAFVQFGVTNSTVTSGGGLMVNAIWSNGTNTGYYLNAEFGFGDFFDEGSLVIAVGTYGALDLNGDGQFIGTAPQDGETYSFYLSVEGHKYDEPGDDFYSFKMKKGDSSAISLTSMTGNSPVNFEIQKADGTVLASGNSTASNVSSAISYFVAPYNGTYYVMVTSPNAGTTYNLVVNRNAAMDLEGNNTFDTAQSVISNQVDGRKWVTGAVQSTVSLTAIDSGWYDSNGSHNSFNTNYFVGSANSRELRNFFVFDRSGIDGTIYSATLKAFNPTPGFVSPDGSEAYSLFDVTTSIVSLRAGGTGLLATFTDLGTGTGYGNRVVTTADAGRLVDVGLNADALVALNAASGEFALGGALTSLNGTAQQNVFGFSNGSLARTLDITYREGDIYKIEADARAMLEFETMTPGGGRGLFANTFDPYLALYDDKGNLVAWNDNGANDCRNAELSYKVPKGKGGTYYLKVMSSLSSGLPTSGEYVLSIKGDRVVKDDDCDGDDHSGRRGQDNGMFEMKFDAPTKIFLASEAAPLDIHGVAVESNGPALVDSVNAKTLTKIAHIQSPNPIVQAARSLAMRTPTVYANPKAIDSPFEFEIFVG